MSAPNRQLAFRRVVALHLFVLTGLAYAVEQRPSAAPYLGQLLIVAGIVEGGLADDKWAVEQLYSDLKLEPEIERASEPFLHPGKAGRTREGSSSHEHACGLSIQFRHTPRLCLAPFADREVLRRLRPVLPVHELSEWLRGQAKAPEDSSGRS